MNWKLWLVLISIVLYLIGLLIMHYMVAIYRNGKEEQIVINRAFIAIALLSLLIPILNVICSLCIPLGYLVIKYGDARDMELRKKDDILCQILDWFNKPV